MVLPLPHLTFCQDFFFFFFFFFQFYYLIKSRSHNKEISKTYAPEHITGYNSHKTTAILFCSRLVNLKKKKIHISRSQLAYLGHPTLESMQLALASHRRSN